MDRILIMILNRIVSRLIRRGIQQGMDRAMGGGARTPGQSDQGRMAREALRRGRQVGAILRRLR